MKRHIPNFLTTVNLLFGTFSIMAVFNQHFDWAAIFISFSLVLDYFDGFCARLLNIKSEMGKQLDSLADMISFGLVPGIIMYFLLVNSQGLPKVVLFENNIIPFFGLLITVFSALRLAKFNVDPLQTDKFYGLNTPANTVLVISIALINLNIFNDSEYFTNLTNQAWFLLLMTSISCFLLVSRIPLLAFKFKCFGWKQNKAQYIIIILAIPLLILLKILAFPTILLIYIIISLTFKEQN